jgi:hypothetical protein
VKRFETRSEYIRAIANALGYRWNPGLEYSDNQRPEFPYEYSNNLQVMPSARLDAVLAMVEEAAGETKDGAQEGHCAAILDTVASILDSHRGSRVKSVRALVEELDGVLFPERELPLLTATEQSPTR